MRRRRSRAGRCRGDATVWLVAAVASAALWWAPGCRFDPSGVPIGFHIVAEPPPDTCLGQPYHHRFRAEGGKEPYTWSAVDPLPPGLALDPATGLLSGQATQAGVWSFYVEVEGSDNRNYLSQYTVSTALFAITTPSLPPYCSGTAVDYPLQTCGGTPPVTWSVQAGQLPAGLQLTSDGRLQGTSTVTAKSEVTVAAKDSQGAVATRKYGFWGLSGGMAITSPTVLPAGTISQPYAPFQFEACGGSPPYSWSAGAGSTLPAGLSLSPGGQLAGTPAKAGFADFMVEVSDGSLQGSGPAYLLVHSAPLAITTSSPLPDAIECKSYSLTLAAQGGTGNYSWSLDPQSSLPAGLVLSGGSITGSASKPAATAYAFTVRVTDAGQTASKALALSVLEDTQVTPALTVTEVRHASTTADDEISLSKNPGIKVDFRVAGAAPAQLQPQSATLQVIGGDCTTVGAAAFQPAADVNGDGQVEQIALFNANLVKTLLGTAGAGAGTDARLRFRVEVLVDGAPQSLVRTHTVHVVP